MISFMIEIKETHKSQQRTILAENLHHAQTEILPTIAFKLQISALQVVIFLEQQ